MVAGKKDDTISDVFFKPMLESLATCEGTRNCPEYSDEDFLLTGIGRCLEDVRSGRDWIQRARRVFKLPATVDRFFKSLRSARRLTLIKNVNDSVRSFADSTAGVSDDPFAEHPELDSFAIYAADGHFHGTSAHEEELYGKKRPVGHFFAMNLRTQTMLHLDVARPARKREHDITALKRLEANAMRMGEPQGRRVINAYDPAIYDFEQWYKWKQSKGLYTVTRKKKNIELLYCGQNEFDLNDPRNAGVVSDKVGAPNNSYMLREIVYIDPATGNEYIFLTNEMTLPPGLIAFIYKKRWDIEKVFDQFKNKLMEKKAWAKSKTAKCIQANFMALTHNLMLMIERKVETEEGIVDEKIEAKRKKRILEDLERIKAAGRQENPLVTRAYKAVQRSLQFIRWLRDELTNKSSWREAIDELRPLMTEYLA